MRAVFFILTLFLLISFVFLYLKTWMDDWQREVELESVNYENSYVFTVQHYLSDQYITQFLKTAITYNVYALLKFSVNHPLKYEEGDDLKYVKMALEQAVKDGKVDGSLTKQDSDEVITIEQEEEQWHTLSFLEQQIKDVLKSANVQTQSQFTITSLTYDTPLKLKLSATYVLTVVLNNEITIKRTYTLNNFIVDLNGMPDPFIERKGQDQHLTSNFYYYDYDQPLIEQLLLCEGDCDEQGGNGFFYGPVVKVEEMSNYQGDKSRAILMGTFDELKSVDFSEFGALLQTSAPEFTSTDCGISESKVFNAVKREKDCSQCEEGEDPEDCCVCVENVENVLDRPYAIITDENVLEKITSTGKVLFITKSEPGDAHHKFDGLKVYNIENLRDWVLCAHYIKHEKGMSVAQRMADYIGESENGVLSTVVYRGLSSENQRSRIDKEFFNNVNGIKVRGLPGCKNKGDCKASGMAAPVGQFRISEDMAEALGIKALLCNDGWASCD